MNDRPRRLVPLRFRNGVIVRGDAADYTGCSEIHDRKHFVQPGSGTMMHQQAFEPHQAALKSQFQERALAAEVAGRPGQGLVQLVLAPGRMHVDSIGNA